MVAQTPTRKHQMALHTTTAQSSRAEAFLLSTVLQQCVSTPLQLLSTSAKIPCQLIPQFRFHLLQMRSFKHSSIIKAQELPLLLISSFVTIVPLTVLRTTQTSDKILQGGLHRQISATSIHPIPASCLPPLHPPTLMLRSYSTHKEPMQPAREPE